MDKTEIIRLNELAKKEPERGYVFDRSNVWWEELHDMINDALPGAKV